MMDRSTIRRSRLAGAVLLIGAARAGALTPTPTQPPPLEVRADPDPARSGQTVTLSANRTVANADPHWAQIGGAAVALADSDMLQATFVAPPVGERTTLQFRFSMPPQPDTRDLEVAIVPADSVAVVIDPFVDGPAGGLAEVGVTVDPLGLAIAGLRHQFAFTPPAAVADRGDGTPDCEPGPGIAATFAFLPDGCGAGAACAQLRADLAFAAPLTSAATAYRCRLALTDQPADSCTHALACAGGDATAPGGEGLRIVCSDGSVTAHLPRSDPQFGLRVEPEYPQVGATAHLVFSVAVDGGLPQYHLFGGSPFLDVTAPVPDLGTPGEVAYTLPAVRAGNAMVQLGVDFETEGGCPGNIYFYFTYATSSAFPLTIQDPGGVRLSGRVAEFPGCQGAMRAVDVVLQPGDRVTRTDLSDGSFAFDGVSPGDYVLIVSQGCNPFGCWPARALRVGDRDLSVTLCPQTSACVGDCDGDRRVTIDELIAGVGMALAGAVSPTCAAIDSDGSGMVQIEELITAVNAALEGCSGVDTTTPTPAP